MRVCDIISIASGEVGTTEYPPSSNNVKYNTWFYGREVSGSNYPWCCTFISWLFKDNQSLCKRTASCQDLLSWFESKGLVVSAPQSGDIVFFKYSTNNRRTNHVGLVVSVDGSNIYTIEGNTSVSSNDNGGSVMKRVRTKNIVAYARPSYSGQSHDKLVIKPTLKKGDKGAFVKALQETLNKYGYNLELDGVFGVNTDKAVKDFQRIHGLNVDGYVGPKTWEKLI